MVFYGHLIIIHLMMTIDGQKIEAAETKKALWEDPAMRWELSGWRGWLGNETWRIHGGASNMETYGKSEIFILWTILDHFGPFWTYREKSMKGQEFGRSAPRCEWSFRWSWRLRTCSGRSTAPWRRCSDHWEHHVAPRCTISTPYPQLPAPIKQLSNEPIIMF